jgi:hypothetical protein
MVEDRPIIAYSPAQPNWTAKRWRRGVFQELAWPLVLGKVEK